VYRLIHTGIILQFKLGKVPVVNNNKFMVSINWLYICRDREDIGFCHRLLQYLKESQILTEFTAFLLICLQHTTIKKFVYYLTK